MCNGYKGAIVRHYDGNMYEIRLERGVTCTERVAQLEAMAQDGMAKRYIAKIRNGAKRAYAYGYFNYIKGTASEPDGSYYACGYMAKQAVQIRLNEILRGGSQ